ncbi:MAG: hypothetical protein AAF394_05690 [Planctomycetota bacterium]
MFSVPQEKAIRSRELLGLQCSPQPELAVLKRKSHFDSHSQSLLPCCISVPAKAESQVNNSDAYDG